MRDGGTRQLSSAEGEFGFSSFQAGHRALLVVVSGDGAGDELPLDRPRVRVGRGGDVELRFDDDAMSQEHAAFEFAQDGFRVCDLGSTNGTRVNGAVVRAADLDHGDRIEIGQHVFQLVVEERPRKPRVHVLPAE